MALFGFEPDVWLPVAFAILMGASILAYVILDGVLDLVVEGETHELVRGDVVRVGPQLRRKLVNRGPDRVVLIALGGSAEHRGRDGEAFSDWDSSTPTPPQELPLPDDLPADELR